MQTAFSILTRIETSATVRVSIYGSAQWFAFSILTRIETSATQEMEERGQCLNQSFSILTRIETSATPCTLYTTNIN